MRNKLRYLWLAIPIAVVLFFPTLHHGLHAQAGHSITLTWTAPTTGGAPSSYNIMRGTTSGAETVLSSVVAPTTTYVDSAGVAGTNYFYVVTSSNGFGTSGPSNEVSAIFLGNPPGAPGGLAAVSR